MQENSRKREFFIYLFLLKLEMPHSQLHFFLFIGSFFYCLSVVEFEHGYLGIPVLQLQVWGALSKAYLHSFHEHRQK